MKEDDGRTRAESEFTEADYDGKNETDAESGAVSAMHSRRGSLSRIPMHHPWPDSPGPFEDLMPGSWRERFKLLRPEQEEFDDMWEQPDHEHFKVRGQNYMKDRKKYMTLPPSMHLARFEVWGAEGDTKLEHVSARSDSLAALAHQRWGPNGPRIFLLHIQVPGTPNLSLLHYWAMDAGASEEEDMIKFEALFRQFVDGGKSFCDSRFKLIPSVRDGPWVVRKGVGARPVLLGKKLNINYYRGPNYFELCLDTGSDPVADRVIRMCRGYARALDVDVAIVLQGENEGELPERVLGLVKFNHVELTRAPPMPPLPPVAASGGSVTGSCDSPTINGKVVNDGGSRSAGRGGAAAAATTIIAAGGGSSN